jgi:hypothetical protein
MVEFRAEHSERSHFLIVPLPLAEAFALFEPEGERLWAEGWDPRYHFPDDGRARRGMVFTTGHGGEHTIWTLIRHEPANGLVEYVRTTPGSRTGTVLVHCTALDATRTRVNVAYTLTALTPEGNTTLREMDEARFRAFIESWAEAIAQGLARRKPAG